MASSNESWAGPIVGWAMTAGVYESLQQVGEALVRYGVPLCVAGATLWWTVEKALAQRAVRRFYDRAADGIDHRTLWDRLRRRPMMTDPVPLDGSIDDTDLQAHHIGKDQPR